MLTKLFQSFLNKGKIPRAQGCIHHSPQQEERKLPSLWQPQRHLLPLLLWRRSLLQFYWISWMPILNMAISQRVIVVLGRKEKQSTWSLLHTNSGEMWGAKQATVHHICQPYKGLQYCELRGYLKDYGKVMLPRWILYHDQAVPWWNDSQSTPWWWLLRCLPSL